ncbi:Fork head domain transcription factor-like protein [Emericellopsis cladophorae]|uniref:Fork head domain transcription factor-like protein n=1 Tax=Emericellopsis cladophorae TaxID=2686198 RepID=A0A9P9Y2J0_9HYPO|nr:Fork head domain transcription factor-like protein [Emericellopsis cladophorae]KAI6782334.1 Fork head domain transcription factor-like protein [Emericellopsis cladophorae]
MESHSYSEDGIQPQSHTSPLLPEPGEQSCSTSEFGRCMKPPLAQPVAAAEQTSKIPSQGEGSLSQASTVARPEAPGQSQVERNKEQNHQRHQLHPIHSPKTSAPMPVFDSETLHHSHNSPRQLEPLAPPSTFHYNHFRNNHMWYTSSSARDDLHQFGYGDSPTSASGATTQTSNFSPASPAATCSSTGNSFHTHGINDRLAPESVWREHNLSTPSSVDGSSAIKCYPGSSADSDIEVGSNSGYDIYPDPGEGTDRRLEPLDPVDDSIYTEFDAMAGDLASGPDSQMVDRYGLQTNGGRASEPPMEPSASTIQAKPEEPYAQLIYRALKSAPGNSMSLQDLYTWFQSNTDKCKRQGKGWQNSIRHNLSMNAGFTKRDRKQASAAAAINMAPEMGQASLQETGSSNEKRSTEWTLTDEAIRSGVQSTTRYRNKKSEAIRNRDRSHAASPQSSYYHLGQGTVPSSATASRNGYCAYRVTKPRSGLRMALRSGYIPRTSSPAEMSYYHSTLLSQASPAATPIPGMGMEPHHFEGPFTADKYAMMMSDGSGMVHHQPTQSPFEMESQNLFLTDPHPPQHLTPPEHFSYGDHDMRMGYHAPGDTHVSMPVTTADFDPTLTHSFCDWDPQGPRF